MKLIFSDKANFSGIKIIHMPTKAEVGEIIYQTSVDEIYEVLVLENQVRPNILNTHDEIHKFHLLPSMRPIGESRDSEELNNK